MIFDLKGMAEWKYYWKEMEQLWGIGSIIQRAIISLNMRFHHKLFQIHSTRRFRCKLRIIPCHE